MSMPKLTAKQARFTEEYAVDGNATQAVFRAGYSARTVKEQGCRLLTKVHVRRQSRRIAHSHSVRLRISQERVLIGLLESIDKAKSENDPATMIAGWREIGRLLRVYDHKPLVHDPFCEFELPETEIALTSPRPWGGE